MKDRCGICYQDIGQDQVITFCSSCGSPYHRECIQKAVSDNNSCPSCRQAFVADGLRAAEPESTGEGSAISASGGWGKSNTLGWDHYSKVIESRKHDPAFEEPDINLKIAGMVLSVSAAIAAFGFLLDFRAYGTIGLFVALISVFFFFHYIYSDR